ncbi:DUF1501 domain-containing protein [Patulibacter sp. SYSU D01012]|uniref:DUF1501 domain-containing protein n=1 Tax=Patulibacter sp. SYSU D01012 TaxID=2817381 RepID=UPI001B3042C7|nr:DUF1501 domain-containing protein [Patulibacter sp. SYSU D01012]
MADHHHCRGFARTEQLRSAAEAGRGLPAIEAGMPLPAGTGLDRRAFLLRGLGLGLAVYTAGRWSGIDALEAGVAQAASGPAAPILLSVFLPGGVDGMSVLAPVGDPRYRKLRPKLALGEGDGTAFSEDHRLRWHPAAAGLAQLHAEGKVTVLPAVGYDHPDQSHFTSRHYWEVGALDATGRTGWMGRYLDRVGTPDNPLQGLALDGRLAPALASSRVPVAAIGGPSDYDFGAQGIWGDVAEQMLAAMGDIGAVHAGSGDPALRVAGAAAVQADRLRAQLAPFRPVHDDAPAYTSPVAYPHSSESAFPQRLADLAAMIAAGLPLRCVALTAAGEYDTHDHQADALASGLKLTFDSLLAFQRDLEARGLADRVLIHVWSEFGRRAEENGSLGTDHGAAGVGFVVGTRASGRMVGEFPGLGALDKEGNLRATSDFRGVYSALLEQWLSTDAGLVIPDARRVRRPHLVR